MLPFLYGTPRWLAAQADDPADRQRPAAGRPGRAFLEAAVKRYGPGGEFWDEHAPAGVQYQTAIPQPAADPQLADLERGQLLLLRLPGLAEPLREAAEALRPGDQSRRSERQGDPLRPLRRTDRRQARAGCPPSEFLAALYRAPGDQEPTSTASPCTPTRSTRETLEELVEELHEVSRRKPRPAPASTSPRWAGARRTTSTRSPSSRGSRARCGELRAAYAYLIDNRAASTSRRPTGSPGRTCRRLQLLRLGRPLPRRPAVSRQARLARLRRPRARQPASLGRALPDAVPGPDRQVARRRREKAGVPRGERREGGTVMDPRVKVCGAGAVEVLGADWPASAVEPHRLALALYTR